MQLKPESLRVVYDRREQNPWDLSPLVMEAGSLQSADYTLAGWESEIAIEKKELGDFITCATFERPRWERELARLQGIRHALVIVEADFGQLVRGEYRSKAPAASVIGSVMGWISQFQVPILFVGDREQAQDAARRFLFITARRELERAATLRQELVL